MPDQAAVVFELARKMVEMSPILSGLVKILPSGKRLIGLRKNVLYRALAADGKTAHGQSPILANLDEVGQVIWPVDKFVSPLTGSTMASSKSLYVPILNGLTRGLIQQPHGRGGGSVPGT
jgi:phage terminase large subunit-like protein